MLPLKNAFEIADLCQLLFAFYQYLFLFFHCFLVIFLKFLNFLTPLTLKSTFILCLHFLRCRRFDSHGSPPAAMSSSGQNPGPPLTSSHCQQPAAAANKPIRLPAVWYMFLLNFPATKLPSSMKTHSFIVV